MRNLCYILGVIVLLTVLSCTKDAQSRKEGEGKIEQLEGMYFATRYGYNGAGTYVYYQPYLLLKEGSIRKNLQSPYETLNLEQDLKDHPEKWGNWRKNGTQIVLQWKADQETWDSWYVGFPADDAEKLKGTYTSFFALANSGRGQKYTFREDGTYTMIRQTGSGNKTTEGTYRLKGYGIYFKPNGGAEEGWSFIFMPKDGKKSTKSFLMGEDNFVGS